MVDNQQFEDFTKKPEIIFITYEEVIKNPYPFILRQIINKYRDVYTGWIDFSRIEKMDAKNLLRFCVQRTERNIFREISLRHDFNVDDALEEISTKFDDMYLISELLAIGKNIPFILNQKFTEKIYIYTEKYDKRIHLDLDMNFEDMTKVNYITGNFEEVINSINGITSYILNDIDLIPVLVHNQKTQYTNIIVANYGYNYALNDKDQMVLKINIDEISRPNIFKFATFMPVELTPEHFTSI